MSAITGTRAVPVAPATRRASRTSTPELVLAGSLLAVAGLTAYWWWVTTTGIAGLADATIAAGRLTALAAGVAVIGLILLSARIGPLDRAMGSERAYLWHGRLGRYAIGLIVAHVVLITAGYAWRGAETLGRVIGSFLADSWLLVSLLATVVLLVVGVVSAVAVRRHLAYEVWQAIHLVTYAAILGGLVHEVTTGAQFAGRPVATVLWVGASVAPVVILLANRLVRPLIMNARCRFAVDRVVREADGVFSLVIRGTGLGRVGARAGQYVRVHANQPGLRFASNPYSLSAAPAGNRWRITVAVVGEHSRRLVGLRPGTRLWLEGPLGGLVLDQAVRPVLLVGGGTGIAPLRALAEAALAARPRTPVVVVYRLKQGAPVLFGREWAELTKRSGGWLAVHVRPGPRRAPGNQLTPLTLTAVAPWIGQADVLACGSPELTRAVREVTNATGAASLRVEAFGW